MICVDEKPSIPAVERAQGYLKFPNGRALSGQSHDYKRYGTSTLFAARRLAEEIDAKRHRPGRANARPNHISGAYGNRLQRQTEQPDARPHCGDSCDRRI